jgi:hypothetical protein
MNSKFFNEAIKNYHPPPWKRRQRIKRKTTEDKLEERFV